MSGSHQTSLAVKAVTAAQLSMAAGGVYSVTLDEAIEAMRLTAADMSVKYKETSLSVSPCLFLLGFAQVCSTGSCGMDVSQQRNFSLNIFTDKCKDSSHGPRLVRFHSCPVELPNLSIS